LQFGVVGSRDVADELKEGGRAAFRCGLDAELRKRLDDELAEVAGNGCVVRAEVRMPRLARQVPAATGGITEDAELRWIVCWQDGSPHK
jgi:hypothetical protein